MYSDLTGGYFKLSCWGLTGASGARGVRTVSGGVSSDPHLHSLDRLTPRALGPQATPGRALSPFISEYSIKSKTRPVFGVFHLSFNAPNLS